MLEGVRVLAGPARCGKTTRLLQAYRQVLLQQPLGSALWLSPTSRAAAEVRLALVDGSLSGCLQPQCLTFDHFARRVLEASPLVVRELGSSLVRHLLRQLILQAQADGELEYFAPIAHTPGFLDLVVGTIQEFKRLEIWPEELAAACRRRSSAKDRELCLIYQRYQQRLTSHDLYDAQGRFWQARALMREGQTRPFEHVRHVFVDGFTDLTRTEHEMLELLAQRAVSLSIALPLESGERRGDLFCKSRGTIDRLRALHPTLQVEMLPRRASDWPALAHLEEHLFANPRQVPVAEDTVGVEIVPAAGAVQEIETLARRIKQLLVSGDQQRGGRPVRPQDVLVVFRSLGDVAELADEVFGQFGVPVAIGSRLALLRAPLASALLGWLRLARDDWPFRPLLAMLGHNSFRPAWPEWQAGAVAAANRVIYAAQVPTGREALQSAVQRMAGGNASSVAASAKLAAPLLNRVAKMLDRLPQRATLEVWRASLVDLAASSGLLREDPKANGGAAQVDRTVWDALLAALAAHEHLSLWLGQTPPEYTLAEFCDHLSEVLHSEPLPTALDETGRVRILSAEQARNLSAPYLFVAGLSEKAFPPAAQDDCLISEADARELIRAGLPLVSHADRPRFEMLLFYEVVTRATRQLVLSYPALDMRAQPLSPSPYLTEVEQACGAGRIRRQSVAELSSVPTSDEVLSGRELRVRAMSQARAGEMALWARFCRHGASRSAAGNLLSGIAATRARQGTTFGPYEGMLLSAAAEALLKQKFGPEHCWSPSQMEQYAYCPYQFLLHNVLKIEPLEEMEFEADYSGRGKMLHWLLSTLHRRLKEIPDALSPGKQSAAAFRQAAEALMAELVTQQARSSALGEGMLRIDARRVSDWLLAYQDQHRAYEALWGQWPTPLRPAHFEVAFGPSRRSADPSAEPVDQIDRLSTHEPFELVYPGETIRFAGRIDRIDLGHVGDQAVFNIVDYKSGKASRRTSLKAVLEGNALQLPLYALAAQKLLAQHGALPFRAAYWHVGGHGYREQDAVQFHVDDDGKLSLTQQWGELEVQLRTRVRSLVDGVRSGQFPMHSADDDCTSRCAYRTVCRVNQARSLEKQWRPPEEVAQAETAP